MWNFQFRCTTSLQSFSIRNKHFLSLLDLHKDIDGTKIYKNLTFSFYKYQFKYLNIHTDAEIISWKQIMCSWYWCFYFCCKIMTDTCEKYFSKSWIVRAKFTELKVYTNPKEISLKQIYLQKLSFAKVKLLRLLN